MLRRSDWVAIFLPSSKYLSKWTEVKNCSSPTVSKVWISPSSGME